MTSGLRPAVVRAFMGRSGELREIAEQLGRRLRVVMRESKHLTREFEDQLNALGLRVTISGWDGPEDYALIEKNDPAP